MIHAHKKCPDKIRALNYNYTLHLLPSRLYCRYWNLTSSAKKLADFTAGQELKGYPSHLALKTSYLIEYNILYFIKYYK